MYRPLGEPNPGNVLVSLVIPVLVRKHHGGQPQPLPGFAPKPLQIAVYAFAEDVVENVEGVEDDVLPRPYGVVDPFNELRKLSNIWCIHQGEACRLDVPRKYPTELVGPLRPLVGDVLIDENNAIYKSDMQTITKCRR